MYERERLEVCIAFFFFLRRLGGRSSSAQLTEGNGWVGSFCWGGVERSLTLNGYGWAP
jgi:hypothetical protein